MSGWRKETSMRKRTREEAKGAGRQDIKISSCHKSIMNPSQTRKEAFVCVIEFVAYLEVKVTLIRIIS